MCDYYICVSLYYVVSVRLKNLLKSIWVFLEMEFFNIWGGVLCNLFSIIKVGIE